MNARKRRRDIDKAIDHLMSYANADTEWLSRIETVHEELYGPVVDLLGLDQDEADEFFFSEYLGHMTIGFVFEECATTQWNNEDLSLIGRYLKRRGWRDAATGQRYLKALDQSELEFWEVVALKPGVSIDIRAYGTKDKPIRVKEKLASEGLNQWDGLAARVLRLDGANMFSGAMLPFDPTVAERVHESLLAIPEDSLALMQQLVDDGELDTLPEDMDLFIRENENRAKPIILFQSWAMETYSQANAPLPQMFNMDNEPIEPTQLHFPLSGRPNDIIKSLNASPLLEAEGDDSHWIWIPDEEAKAAQGERFSVLGHIELSDTKLQLVTNSTARAKRGGKILSFLLGGLVGDPLTVHENLEQMLSEHKPNDLPAEIPPEVKDAVSAHMRQHYMQTLDEPMPMLNGKTPRQCAIDPDLKHEVVSWLKYLENMSSRSDTTTFDLAWMWDELDLVRE